MKRIAFLLLILGLTVTQTWAQATTSTEAGRLLNQFADALDGSTLIDQWQLHKTSYKNTVAKISNGTALAKNTLALYQYIKPEKFKTTFDRKKFEKDANSAKTYAEAANALKNLEEGLKEDAFDRYVPWRNQRIGWQQKLLRLK
ncbi:MAG: hypothetical protein QM731_03125 [Chitinophagaceae bacterium]